MVAFFSPFWLKHASWISVTPHGNKTSLRCFKKVKIASRSFEKSKIVFKFLWFSAIKNILEIILREIVARQTKNSVAPRGDILGNFWAAMSWNQPGPGPGWAPPYGYGPQGGGYGNWGGPQGSRGLPPGFGGPQPQYWGQYGGGVSVSWNAIK